MNGPARDDTHSQIQALAVLLALPLLLAGFLFKDQILSRVIANYAAIQMINAPGLQLIDFRAYPTCENSERYAQPASLFNQALELDPYNRAAWLNLLKVRWASGDCNAVEQMLASGQAPVDSSLTLISALLDIHLEQFKGRENYLNAVEIGQLFDQVGAQAEDQELLESAAQWYQAAYLFDPTLKKAEWLVDYYTALADGDRMAWVWDFLAQEKAGTEDGWWALFFLSKLEDDLDGMIAALESSLEDNSSLYEIFLELGHAYRQSKRYQDALVAYEHAKELNADVAWPIIAQGEVYMDIGDMEKAKDRLLFAQEVDPSNPFSYYFLGLTYDQIGDFEAAIDQMKIAIELRLASGFKQWTMSELLGHIYLKAGRCADAKAAYEQALEWQPEEPRLIEYIQNLASCSD